MILQINDYELVITYSWGSNTQGMSGHLFECIEYYYILKNHFNVCIFIPEKEMTKEFIEKTIREKYTFNDDEVNNIIDNMVFENRPNILKGKNLLLVDGNFTKTKKTPLLFDNIMAFPCADMEFKNNTKATIFQDDRIYGKSKAKTVHYIKKLLLNKYKEIKISENKYMIYITSGPREFTNFDELPKSNYIVLSNMSLKLPENFELLKMPVKNLFERFQTYVYTPTDRKFDCSSRFLVECKFYNKEVIFHNIDYFEQDLGLKYRIQDIKENFESLILKDDDEIINLIGDVIG